jgi:phosphatidate cytidylyltransferase
LAFLGLFAFFTIIGLNEFYQLAEGNPKAKPDILFLTSGLLIFSIIALVGIGFLGTKYLFVALLTIFFQVIFELYKNDKPSWSRIGSIFSALFFVAIPFGLMASFYYSPSFFSGSQAINYQSGTLIGLFLIMWSNDVFAYLVGSKFGKRKLFERHSPKKSWEGSVGGFVFAMVAAYILSVFYTHLSQTQWIGMGAIIAVSGTYGDLAESLLKRNAGVKDSGTIFPGHGGVLDRFDAVLFASPFVFVYLNLI